MELLREISESDLGINTVKSGDKERKYTLRKAIRALVFNRDGKIALLNVARDNYHKLPGGGIEEGEDLTTALRREVKEETGCEISIRQRPIGSIIEYRDEFSHLQISYCFLVDVIGDIGETAFTKDEQDGGFTLAWLSIDNALQTLQDDQPDNYMGKFIQQRDITFLIRAKTALDKGES